MEIKAVVLLVLQLKFVRPNRTSGDQILLIDRGDHLAKKILCREFNVSLEQLPELICSGLCIRYMHPNKFFHWHLKFDVNLKIADCSSMGKTPFFMGFLR
jgi:hypothetical protein